MTNKEYYAKEIFDIACTGSSIAVTKSGRLLGCNDCSCCDCAFNDSSNMDCSDICKAWCNSEYKEPEVDWSKVPIDTPIYIKQSGGWVPRYFAGKYSDNGIYHFSDGKTSFTNEDVGYTSYISFDNVKLARPEDIKKYNVMEEY